MSLIPELILQTVIVRGIHKFRSDSRYIDQLFRNLDQASLDQIHGFLRDNTIDLALNYPAEPPKLPAMILVLKSSAEAQGYLADSRGLGKPDEFSFDGPIEGQTLGGVGTVSELGGLPELLFGPWTAAGGTTTTLIPSGTTFDRKKYQNKRIELIKGKGAGQYRTILTNDLLSVTVTQPWLVIPDNTTIFVIRDVLDTRPLGEPSSLYDRNQPSFVEGRGLMEKMSYQLLVVCNNPQLTIYLSAIVKSIFLLSRQLIEAQGLLNLTIGATDFLPRADYLPTLSYQRAINIEFWSEFQAFEDMASATSLDLAFEYGQTIIGENTVPLGPTGPSIGP